VLKDSIDRIEGWTPVEETVNWGGRARSVVAASQRPIMAEQTKY